MAEYRVGQRVELSLQDRTGPPPHEGAGLRVIDYQETWTWQPGEITGVEDGPDATYQVRLDAPLPDGWQEWRNIPAQFLRSPSAPA